MPSNDYYDHTTYPGPNAPGSSAALRAELDSIEQGFLKLPTLTGNGNKVVVINAGGTALTSTLSLSGLTLNNTTIGTTTPAAGAFTTLSASIGITGNLNGNVTGNVTAGSGTSTFNNVTINGTLDMASATVGSISGLQTPSSNDEAANKAYVDTQRDTRLALAGGTMSGAIAMGSNKITGLGTPTNSNDAVNLDYVSTLFGSTAAAATSAAAAASSASAAANSATSAQTFAGNAQTSATDAAASYDAFDDRYLGAKASDPTLDNDGNALLTGAIYWNTGSSIMKVWTGSAWIATYLPASGYLPLTGGTMTGNLLINSGVDSRVLLQSSGTTQGQFQTTASLVRVASNNTLPLVLSTNGVDRLTFDDVGNITFGSATATGVYTFRGLNTGDLMVLESTDASASAAPDLVLYRNSASPAAADQVGVIIWRGKDSGGADQQYARVGSEITDATAGTEGADLWFEVTGNGAATERLRLRSTGAVGFNGANYGTSGQALVSGGASAAPTWSDVVTPTGTQTLTNKTISGGVYSGNVDQTGSVRGGITAVAALDINCSSGNYFTKTINANSTFTVSNVPASRAYAFTLELTHTSGTVTWFSGVQWPGGTAPTLTTGKVHLFTFVTDDGGTSWRGASQINYAA